MVINSRLFLLNNNVKMKENSSRETTTPDTGQTGPLDPNNITLMQIAELLDRRSLTITQLQEQMDRLAEKKQRLIEGDLDVIAAINTGALRAGNKDALDASHQIENSHLNGRLHADAVKQSPGAGIRVIDILPNLRENFHLLLPGEIVILPTEQDNNLKDERPKVQYPSTKSEITIEEKFNQLIKIKSIRLLLDENSDLWIPGMAVNGKRAIGKEIVLSILKYKNNKQQKDTAFASLITQRIINLKRHGIEPKVKDQKMGLWDQAYVIEFLYNIWEGKNNNNSKIEIDENVCLNDLSDVKKNFMDNYQDRIKRRTRGKFPHR
jgi:hypothetical protein